MIRQLQQLSAVRSERWMKGQHWTGLEIAGAMCGEAGEAANVAKKLRRLEMGVSNNVSAPPLDRDQLVEKLRLECGDAIGYMFMLANHYEFDLEEAARDAFNYKSDQMGFPEHLPKLCGDKMKASRSREVCCELPAGHEGNHKNSNVSSSCEFQW